MDMKVQRMVVITAAGMIDDGYESPTYGGDYGGGDDNEWI